MMKFFEKIRSAPEETRKMFAVVTSGVLTFVIVIISWSYSNPLASAAKSEPEKDKLPSPLSTLTKGFGESFGGVKNDLTAIPFKELFMALLTPSPKATTTPSTEATSNVSATTTLTTALTATTTATTTVKKKPIKASVAEKPTVATPKGQNDTDPFALLDARALTAAASMSTEIQNNPPPKDSIPESTTQQIPESTLPTSTTTPTQ